MPNSWTHSRFPSRRIALAICALAASLLLGLVDGPETHAQNSRLEAVRSKQDAVRAKLDEQNAAINSLIGEVSDLRVRQQRVTAALAKEEAELANARQELATARAELVRTRRRFGRSQDDLAKLLDSIYRYGDIDATTVLLNSDGVDDFVTRSAYLDRIHDYETGVVTRVRTLKAKANAHVATVHASVGRIEAARNAIAEREQRIATARVELEAQHAALQAAQADRLKQLSKLKGDAKDIVAALAAQAPADPAAAPAAPLTHGSVATINSDGTASAPADAPAAVKNAIAAGNQITNTPYLWGGGHGSFESNGYDCSGSVSFALHGGGLLSSPLDSTGFMTWGDPGPGKWITVFSNPSHAFMFIAGIRFDTSGAPPRWQPLNDTSGFVATHPPGL